MKAISHLFRDFNVNRLTGPVLVIMVLAMMILPLPPFLLDLFFTFNIAISIIVLLVSLYTTNVLEFAVFPTVLLITALLRLSLNIASTRLVLMNGHAGGDAAGKVIEAFGHFLIGGNPTVGIVVFIILVVINFVVITKGAGRIAEVSARFTLDALPGKQMAIDADLNAGMINEEQAKKRRSEVQQEADFYGSMDGASKFVRGDAVAGIIIMLINIIGGLIVGVVQHDLAFVDAAHKYTLLTVGDGLVAQIPSLVISVAAGIIVTRVSTEQDMSEQLLDQLILKRAQVMIITAILLLALGVIPGMPHLAFIAMSSLLFGAAYYIEQRKAVVEEPRGPDVTEIPDHLKPTNETPEVTWDDVLPVDTLGLEVGYRLIPLVDRTQDGDLLKRIRGIRKKIAQDLGFLVPSIHIRDNLQLKPSMYRIMLKGVEIAQAEAHAGMFLAINPGRVLGQLSGPQTFDPTFGLPATWIDHTQKDLAQTYGYTVVDTSTVIATHLSHIIQENSSELLGRDQVQQLLDHVAKESPKLIEELVPKVLPLNIIQKVLQNLLEESVHIRDMRTILEAMADVGTKMQDPDELTSVVRVALGRSIIHEIFPGQNELSVIALDPGLEQILMQAVQAKTSDGGVGLEPGLAEAMLVQTRDVVQQQEQMGLVPVLLVPPALRNLMAKFLRRASPQLKVLSHAEIPDSKNIKVTAVLGGRG